MKDSTDLDNLNNRLYNSVKDLGNIQDEKRELERSPEENAPRILELKSLEESKFDEINQIRSDKAELEPQLGASLGDKLHDLGQNVKTAASDIGAAMKNWVSNLDGGEMAKGVAEVIGLMSGQPDVDTYKTLQEQIYQVEGQQPTGQVETTVQNVNSNDLVSFDKVQEDIKNTNENNSEKQFDALDKSTELGKGNSDDNRNYHSPELKPANDNNPISPKDGPDRPDGGIAANKEKTNEGDTDMKQAANDNVKPANDNTSLDTLLERYEKDYNKVNFATDSPEKAEEKATDNLLEKLDKQREPNQESNKQTENGQSKEDKVKDLLKEQYGDKGVEAFERIKEKEREQQPEKQNTQEQTR